MYPCIRWDELSDISLSPSRFISSFTNTLIFFDEIFFFGGGIQMKSRFSFKGVGGEIWVRARLKNAQRTSSASPSRQWRRLHRHRQRRRQRRRRRRPETNQFLIEADARNTNLCFFFSIDFGEKKSGKMPVKFLNLFCRSKKWILVRSGTGPSP